jgi:hypothetical protein
MSAMDQEDPTLRNLLSELHDEPGDGLGAGFGASLHRRLASAGPPAPVGVMERVSSWVAARPLTVGLASGSVAGVLVFLALAELRTEAADAGGVVPGDRASAANQDGAPASNDSNDGPAPTAGVDGACEPSERGLRAGAEVFVVPAGKVAMVQLHFAVDQDVEEAEFGVLLPRGLAFFNDGEALEDRSFHWVAPLSEGDNRIPIAIVGEAPGQHRLTATATVAGEVVVHEIVLDVQEEA